MLIYLHSILFYFRSQGLTVVVEHETLEEAYYRVKINKVQVEFRCDEEDRCEDIVVTNLLDEDGKKIPYTTKIVDVLDVLAYAELNR